MFSFKGIPFSVFYTLESGSSQVADRYIEISQFNNLFGYIKKSRNKRFDFNSSHFSQFRRPGTVGAEALSVEDFNVIVMCSRGEMIPYSLQEQQKILSIIQETASYLELALSNSTFKLEENHFNDLMVHLPIS